MPYHSFGKILKASSKCLEDGTPYEYFELLKINFVILQSITLILSKFILFHIFP